MRIYVASSWRNAMQAVVVNYLRDAGHEVYDFRNPRYGMGGFEWGDIDRDWRDWDPKQFVCALEHTIAEAAFTSDLAAMEWADACVLVLPCGLSAHLEAG